VGQKIANSNKKDRSECS